MAADRDTTGDVEFELDERGFQGTLRIEEHGGARHVVLSGVRPDGSESAIQKDVPADRDEHLAELVQRTLTGDAEAAVAVLGHLGVLDPEP
jgi:hypothetical protein